MTHRSFALLGCLLLAACPGEEEPTDPTDTPPACEVISESYPQPDATGVYYRTTLTWNFSAADTSATATVVDDQGAEVAGTSSWIGTTYLWEPNAPLASNTTYTATMSFCDGANMPATSFTTSGVGGAADLLDIQDKTYALDIGQDSEARVIQPPGVGPLLQQQLTDNNIDILIGVQAADAANITLLGALGDGNNPLGQELCRPTIPFPAANFAANPYFTVGPQDVLIEIDPISLTLQGLNVDGAFAPDGSFIAGATLSGTINVNDLVPLAGEDGDAVCELAGNLGVVCEDCGGGAGNYCLTALIVDIEATALPGVTVTPVLEDTCTN